MAFAVHHLGVDDVPLMDAMRAMFGAAFEDEGTYLGEPPSADETRAWLAREGVIALAAVEDGAGSAGWWRMCCPSSSRRAARSTSTTWPSMPRTASAAWRGHGTDPPSAGHGCRARRVGDLRVGRPGRRCGDRAVHPARHARGRAALRRPAPAAPFALRPAHPAAHGGRHAAAQTGCKQGGLPDFLWKKNGLQRPYGGRKKLLLLNCTMASNGYRLFDAFRVQDQ